MNPYKQPENKLTYNLLCVIKHMEQPKAFCEFLLDNKNSLSESPIMELETQVYRNETKTKPDGMMKLQSPDKKEYSVYLENKTFRSPLTESQLRNHISEFCKDENSFLLVTTPRISDKKIIDKIKSDKIIFKTWSQVAEKLEDINREEPSFIISQFIEYGKLRREFEDMEHVTKKELESYIETIKSNVEGKMEYIFEGIKTVNFDNYGLNVTERKIEKHWGRHGIEFSFTPKNDYRQWFFYGIYFNSNDDHKIPFKIDRVPELAFFFDIGRDLNKGQEDLEKLEKIRANLENKENLLDALKRLSQKGFEDNLTYNLTFGDNN